MKANETRIEDFLSQNKTQFVIPVYQRNYDWNIVQCKQLLNDIFQVGSNDKMSAHFIGSIVYIHDDVYTASRIKELTIIDGQQRLTTLTLIYLVIYKLAKELNEQGLENEINETYLINKFASEEEKLKLKPTENNSKAFKYLLYGDEKEEFSDFSKLIENFKYFKSNITKENYQIVLKGLSKLMFVEISLDKDKDDPQRIFESLNSTGLELTQSDLIRNYILMGLSRTKQDKIYQNYWEKIELLAKDEKNNRSLVSEFMRDYLTLTNKKIPNKAKVYAEFKEKYSNIDFENLEKILGEIKVLAQHYNKLLNPHREPNPKIRKHLEYLNKLEINVSYPFLMKVYDDFSNQIIDEKTFIQVLELIQSFTWRRFIVGLATNALNKIFMSLYDKVDTHHYLFSIQKALLDKGGHQRFPRNTEVLEILKTKDVYNIQSKNRTYLLERLENHNNNEPVNIEGNEKITIEHIFPQSPEAKWKEILPTEEYNYIKENYLNTIANLTLSGNNGKLSNKIFTEKRDLPEFGYKKSRLWLNQYLANLEKWDKAELEARYKVIAHRFLEIWQIPDIEFDENINETEINIFDADSPTGKKLEYVVFLGETIEMSDVASLYSLVMKKLFELDNQKFFTTELREKLILNTNKLHRQPIKISENYYIEGNIDNKGKFERMKLALTIFNMEEDLIIKYKN